MGTDLTYV